MRSLNAPVTWSKGSPSRRVALSPKRQPNRHLCRADSGQSSGIEVELADNLRARFPETGSGLLWARTTGLKVWDGAKVLSQLLLRPGSLDDVVAKAPSFQRKLQEDNSRRSNSADNCLLTLEDRAVVELGAGLGLCSVAAAHQGAQVVATDGDADLVRLLKKNLAFNNGEVLLTAEHLRERKSQSAAEAGQQLSSNSHMSETDVGMQRRFRHPPQACLLIWGQEQAVEDLKGQLLRMRESRQHASQAAPKAAVAGSPSLPQQQHSYRDGAPDVILLAEVVYGSDPGVWQALISTLKSLCDSRTLILQAESRRIEGVLYGEYWAMLEAEFFQVVELPLTEMLGPELGLGRGVTHGSVTPEVQRSSLGGENVLEHEHQSANNAAEFSHLGGERQQCHSRSHVRAWVIHRMQVQGD